jgi:hypothetical protein
MRRVAMLSSIFVAFIELGTTAHASHAYITDAGGQCYSCGKLLQYDINDGVVVPPARVIAKNLNFPLGVAVGPHGLVYVAEQGDPDPAIDVYEVMASSVQLVRRMTMHVRYGQEPEPEYLAIDQRSYLYSTMDFLNLAVFRPGTNGPIHHPHYLQGDTGAFLIGSDYLGDVYQPGSNFLYVHPAGANGLAKTTPELITPPPSIFDVIEFARADGKALFVGPAGISRNWIAVGVMPIHTWGVVPVERTIILKDGCWAGSPLVGGISIAVKDGFLYEICGYVSRSNHYIRRIWTYDDRASGVVEPLGAADLPVRNPGDIAIGP